MTESVREGIAIVGMEGRFPGAESVEQLWANLVAGRESISFFDDAELVSAGLDPVALRAKGHYVAAGGVLKDADCFDAAFFGISPKEAEAMDPQHRVFLEACWSALERAGYAPDRVPGAVGVFAGATFNTYYERVLQHRPDLLELVGADQVMLGNEKDYLCTRVAYKLGLTGPALNISTACSTSLVAVAQACQALVTYQCDMALAGGVSVRVPQQHGYYHDDGNIGSVDGHTRTFDAQSSGTTFSNGVAVVVLKRFEDAVKDGDRIFAVITGAALNNDGSQRVSFGAPGVDGQARAIALAHALADVNPETITCVEAHGTATPLGDPIEVAGLTKAFRMGTDARGFCALGSIKSNIGHLDAAAGVTGLIKMALSLHHKVIPASLHFQAPNPKLDLENSPFFINAALRQWTPPAGVPCRGGVSSFGTGGTNAHIVVEEAPDIEPSGKARDCQLLVLSARTSDALERATSNLRACLHNLAGQPEDRRQQEFADIAFTLHTGRSEFVHRRIVACENPADGADALASLDPKRVFTSQQKLTDPPIAFLFPGQGAQYAGMGAELYRLEPVFRDQIDRCAMILQPLLGTDIRTVLFSEAESRDETNQLLMQTRFTQPALFMIEYALAQLWMSWGIKPSVMIGHSVGEYVAGCISGVFSLEDGLALVAQRAALVQAQPGGAMLAVRLPESEVLPLLNPALAIAAVNSPTLCVVAGPYADIAELETRLQGNRVAVRRLKTSHAFHSPMMDPVIEPFTALLRSVKLGSPQIPFISNVTARYVTDAETGSPEYWAGHMRQAVRFSDGVAELVRDHRNVLLEVGPGLTLATLARQHPAHPAEQVVLASMPQTGSLEQRGVLETLGRLWLAGVPVDWAGFHAGENRRRTLVPTYPFERKRYWPEPAGTLTASVATAVPPPVTKSAPAPAAACEYPDAPVVPRKDRLLVEVRKLIEELSGYDLSEVNPAADLLEFGLDSLLLTQASQLLQRKFSVAITFRQLMEELSSLDTIASYLDAKLPSDAFAVATVPQASVATAGLSTNLTIAGSTALEQLLAEQQQLTNRLLGLLGRAQGIPAPPAVKPAITAPAPQEHKSHGPFKPIQRGIDGGVSTAQRAAIDAFIDRYTRKTAGSKQFAAANRPILADPRSVSGFKQLWKEMVYPIYTTRSDGSRVWDVDGNEYIDFVMGFGASLFGHRPSFVVQAMHEQLDRGFEIGPIQPLAGEVASLVRELTGMQRVGFTNTGSEAVLAATRISRTATGRSKIAVFAGAYHGIFDEVLFRPLTINGETRTAAIAPGIPASALEQVIVLDWANPQSLEILRARGDEVAAVLVEPVQSRRLDVQPAEFLRGLRQVTLEIGAALIFDEVVTGFRLHPGGAQAYFGIRADLATYGKVMGGGISIGVVAGDPKYMDVLDGGGWQYGDASFPEVGVTFFAGTFVRHPLAMAAAKAVLVHLKEAGPALQRDLNDRTARIAERLREVVAQYGIPCHVTQFSSLIQLGFPADQKLAGLFFYLLRYRGIHIYENRAFVITTSHTDEDIDRLVEAFRESFAEMRRAECVAANPDAKVPAVATVPASPRASTFPLTEAQKEIWLASQMGGDAAGAGFNESLRLDFQGDFNEDLFRSAVNQVLKRHPIVFARFSADGQSQEIRPGGSLEIPSFDFSAETAAEQRRKLEDMIDRETSDVFDLTQGPLLRIRIVRLSGNHHVILWTAHHIVCDGWSTGLLISEIGQVYSASRQGVQATLEEPASFRNYALASIADAPGVRDAVAYWREQFTTMPPPLDLPADHARPPARSARAFTAKRKLDARLLPALKQLARQQRTTMVVLLLATLKTLIHRLTGQTDVVIGMGAAGQAITGQNCLAGHCLNLLPIRTHLDADASFQEVLAMVRKGVLDAYDHHQCTLGSILQNLKAPRTTARPPLVEVIFNVDRDSGATSFSGLDLTCDRNPKRALHFDLFLNVVESSQGLLLECDYNTDLFEPATIDRWLQHFETLLESVTSTPAEQIGKLPLLTASERRLITEEWNNTHREYPRGRCLFEYFEDQVERTPDAPAVVYENERLSYRELNGRANQLANYLRKRGVGAETLVPVLMDRSLEMVVSLLGIIKAGGAYVPLDPGNPTERLHILFDDLRAPIVLTQRRYAPLIPGQECALALDADASTLVAEPATNPVRLTGGKNAVYVIYTSGSTGKPKGVINIHDGIVNRLLWMQDAYRLDGTDTVLQKTPYTFDVSVWEFFWPLITGACLVVARPEGHKDPLYLTRMIDRHRVTTLHFVPSMLELFLATPGLENLRSLRRVICSGEALSFSLQKRFFDRLPAVELHNLYGPTEASVDVTFWACSKESNYPFVPIGRPIANTQIYVVDKYLNPVPIGVPGELLIGGIGVARGYLHRDELTADKFIPDRFTSVPGAKLYKTGDLVRFLADSNIEYIGRMDTQIKIRGFRIELGEIESALARHNAIGQCTVTAYQDRAGERRLAAYIVPRPGSTIPPVADLRAFIRERVPDYMVPSAILPIESLPTTANGKIDYRRLPDPNGFQAPVAAEAVPARDPVEQILVGLWSKILNVRVGTRDHFFEMGGHSLLAVRMMLELEALFGKRLPLATLLQAPTVEALAEVLRRENWMPSWSSLVPIRPGGSRPPLFLVHSHGGNVLEYYPLAELLDSDQPVYGLQAQGLDGQIVKGRSIEEIASAYLRELRTLQPEGPYFLGGFCFGGVVALEMAQQLCAAGEEVELLVLIQTVNPEVNHFRPAVSLTQRWWYRLTKRLDLERDNLRYRGARYILERGRKVWDFSRARVQLALDDGNEGPAGRKSSMGYILEALGVEHDRAYEQYRPRPYFGNTIVFRAAKQLDGLAADSALGWRESLKGRLRVCEVPGHQQNMLVEPNVSVLAKTLAEALGSCVTAASVVSSGDESETSNLHTLVAHGGVDSGRK
jgi:amino acid adenylation domain-containing protein